jgi:hypothetical protein
MQLRSLMWFIAAVVVILVIALAIGLHGGGSFHDWFVRMHGD